MEQIKENTMHENDWSIDYINKVFIEFERFMILKTIDDDLSPSLHIDLLWHNIILNTQIYYNYCYEHFNKIIHHYPINSQLERDKRFTKTINLYIKTFNTEPSDIWQ